MFWRRRDETPRNVLALDADRAAVAAARADPDRFEALYRKYVGQIYNFALYELRDHHAAEDLTEQVFMAALAGLPRFEERGEGEASTFRVWLFRIARNALANERRLARRRPEAPLELALEEPGAIDPAAGTILREEGETVLRALAGLSVERRRALVLRFVEEMTTHEIAAILGRSEGATRVLIHRALRQVAESLPDTRTRAAAADQGRRHH